MTNARQFMAARTAAWAKSESKNAWVMTDGLSSYFDTGVNISNSIRVGLDCVKFDSSQDSHMLGGLSSAQFLILTSVQFQIGGGRTSNISVSNNERHIYEASHDDALTIDGVNYQFSFQPTLSTGGANIYIGCRNLRGTAAGFAKIKLFALNIFDGDELVRSYKPVSVNGAGALYDSVSENVNLGVGSIEYGED